MSTGGLEDCPFARVRVYQVPNIVQRCKEKVAEAGAACAPADPMGCIQVVRPGTSTAETEPVIMTLKITAETSTGIFFILFPPRGTTSAHQSVRTKLITWRRAVFHLTLRKLPAYGIGPNTTALLPSLDSTTVLSASITAMIYFPDAVSPKGNCN